jgi:nickel transport protein
MVRSLRSPNWFFITVLLGVQLLLTPPILHAHKLSVFAWVEGKTVHVEGKLPGGKHPATGKISVFDGSDQLLLEIEIIKAGVVTFPLPEWRTGLKIVLDIGSGHQSFWILTPGDVREQMK